MKDMTIRTVKYLNDKEIYVEIVNDAYQLFTGLLKTEDEPAE